MEDIQHNPEGVSADIPSTIETLPEPVQNLDTGSTAEADVVQTQPVPQEAEPVPAQPSLGLVEPMAEFVKEHPVESQSRSALDLLKELEVFANMLPGVASKSAHQLIGEIRKLV